MRSELRPRSRGFVPFLLPGLLLFTIIIGIPFLMNIGISFTRWTGVGKPAWVGLQNYVYAFHDTVFWASFRNNIALIFAVTVVPTIAGLLLSVFLYDYVSRKLGNPFTSFLRAGYYLPQILPVAIAGVVWGWILNPNYGALNWILESVGLESFTHNWLGEKETALPSVMGIMIWFQIGYPLVIFMSALQRVDPQLLEAAEIDGASWFDKFKINVALIRPEINVVILTTTIYALKLFAQIFVLTRGGPGHATIVPSYFAYQNFFEKAKVGYGSAIATIMTTIIIVLTAIFIKIQFKQERQG